jgi:hypothetical protein
VIVDETLHDLLSKEFFLMARLGQPFTAVEAMPAYEADLFIEMKLEEDKKEGADENA